MATAAPEEAEEYPTLKDLQRAGFLALLMALTGFVLSYLIFVRPERKALELAAVDRRSAERPQPQAYREHSGGGVYVHHAYASAGRGYRERETRVEPLKIPERPTPTRRERPKPKATPVARPLPGSEYQSGDATRPSRMNPAPVQVESPAPSRRPDPKGFPRAWSEAQAGWAQFGDSLRGNGSGVAVSADEILTTLSAYRLSGGRGLLAGRPFQGSLAAADGEHDLALLSCPGLEASPLPFCPEVSSAGETLVTGDPIRGGGLLEVRSRGAAGSFLAFYGWNPSLAGGSPLINDRGELVALALTRPSWGSLSWNVAVPASTLQSFLARRPQAGSSPPPPDLAWSQSLAARLAPGVERQGGLRANARVMPGLAIGNYPLGIHLEQLTRELGPGEVQERRGDLERRHYSGPRLTFTLIRGSAVAIETDYTFYTLESGLAVNSSPNLEQMRANLPGSLVCDTPAASFLVTSGLELEVRQGKVQKIRVMVP